jgi:hypothetical protein
VRKPIGEAALAGWERSPYRTGLRPKILLTGKNTGKFIKAGLRREQWPKLAHSARVSLQIPGQPNRE